jgi:allantoin racemase
MSKYKMLWQSSTAIAGMPEYQNAIEAHAKKVLSSDFELTVRGVHAGTSDLHFMAFDFLNNWQLFDSVTKAEHEGYDAVAIGCFFDPILDELREIMNIPVMSLAEAGMLTACMLGKYFSVVSYVPQNNNKLIAELVHKNGLSDRASPFTSFDLPLTELEKGFINPKPVLERFEAAAREAVKRGAEVILPGCGCLNLVIINGGMHEVDGATVLDVSGALMKMTEMMVVLKEVSGTKVSRKGYYEAPTQDQIQEVLKIYGKQ